MSYILDALRRADAERERDPGRGIHAQPVALPAESARRIPLWIFAGLAGLVLLVAVALLLQPAPRVAQHLGMPPPNAPAVNSASDSPPVTPVASEVSPPAPTLAAARPQELSAEQVEERVPEPRRAARPAVASAPARRAPNAPAVAPPAPVVPPAAAVPAAAPAPAPAPAAGADRVLAASELPPEEQRELPKMQISGGVHSDNPSQRMLIVGGQVVTEGREAAPGVVVEQIRAKSAVLRFRGYRYSVQY